MTPKRRALNLCNFCMSLLQQIPFDKKFNTEIVIKMMWHCKLKIYNLIGDKTAYCSCKYKVYLTEFFYLLDQIFMLLFYEIEKRIPYQCNFGPSIWGI